MKKYATFSFFNGCTVTLAAVLLCCFTACNMNPLDNVRRSKPKTSADVQIPDVPLPPAAEREPITEDDILGKYDGKITIFMNNVELGYSQEKIVIKKSSVTGNVFLRTREKTVYPTHIDLGYALKEVTLSKDADGKGFTFSGDSGELLFYGKKGSTPETSIEPRAKPVILKNGHIYKKNGRVYITYAVVYDMDVIREVIPLLPADHKSLFSIMKEGVKKQ